MKPCHHHIHTLRVLLPQPLIKGLVAETLRHVFNVALPLLRRGPVAEARRLSLQLPHTRGLFALRTLAHTPRVRTCFGEDARARSIRVYGCDLESVVVQSRQSEVEDAFVSVDGQ
jgi:hypothetical protein